MTRRKATFEMTMSELVDRMDDLRQEHEEERAEYVTLAQALQSRKDQQAAYDACRKQ